jgi:hypothetical protein
VRVAAEREAAVRGVAAASVAPDIGRKGGDALGKIETTLEVISGKGEVLMH